MIPYPGYTRQRPCYREPMSRSAAPNKHGRVDKADSWKMALLVSSVAVSFLVMLVMCLAGVFPLASPRGAVLLTLGGFTSVGLSVASVFDRWDGRPSQVIPNLARWLCFVVAAALWAAAPVVLLVAGYDWTDTFGGRRSSLPLWLIAAVAWGLALFTLALPARDLRGSART